MVRIVELDEIQSVIEPSIARRALAEGFIASSRGEVQMPEIGELRFLQPPGEAHVKHGYVAGDDYFVIKVATGFYENPRRGLPAQDGTLLVYERATGRLAAILLDRGWLTDLRTALAGALVAEQLAPRRLERIGVIGTGVQARLQVTYLKDVLDCRRVRVWGRSLEQAERLARELQGEGFDARATSAPEQISECQLVVTATAATEPVLHHVVPGTHVTAVGCDSTHKHEVAVAVFASADLVVADSIPQCLARGDLRHAVTAEAVAADEVVELGDLLAEAAGRRRSPDWITVADLTGLAVQDIAIAQHVLQRLTET